MYILQAFKVCMLLVYPENICSLAIGRIQWLRYARCAVYYCLPLYCPTPAAAVRVLTQVYEDHRRTVLVI